MENVISPPLAKHQKFDSINIMRGIAILMVILVHTSQSIDGNLHLTYLAQYGQMGVQMFFIASAFTLCYSIESREINKYSIRNFYLRRFFRIAPGYYFGILLYFLVTLVLPFGWHSNKNPIDIFINIFFLNGLYPPANDNVVPGGWSIGTEMLFYLVFPFLYLAYNSLQNKYNFTYKILPIAVLFISLLGEVILYSWTKSPNYFVNNGFIYYNLLNQIPVFCIGISLYTAFKNGMLQNISKSICLVLFLFFTFLAAFCMFTGQNFFIFSSVIFPFLSALSFIFVFIFLQYHNKNRGRLLAKIGVLSYSGYLVHFIFAWFFARAMSKIILKSVQPDIQLIILYILTVVLTYLSASLIYKFIEQEGIRLGKKFITRLNSKLNKIKIAS